MAANLIVCGGVDRPRRAAHVVELDTNQNAAVERRVTLKFDQLSRRLVHIEPVLADAVEIAAYVLMADRLIKRGTDQMGRMGAAWRREFHFSIPVRRRDIWASKEVSKTLSDTLSFLSEDQFAFEFLQRDPGQPLDPFIEYGEETAEIHSEQEVILFSGGLDSLAGAVDVIAGRNRRAILVTHKSSTMLAHRQDVLAAKLRNETEPGRVFYAPVWVRKGDFEPTEHSQRTRSFLFASLGFAVANAFRQDTVQFFENGITSFNLPIAEHVIGTRASRTTHPKVLTLFSRLFSLLVHRDVRIENRFLWKTKAEVLEVLHAHGRAGLIAETTSCAGVRNLSMSGNKQCGICSQCIERKFAILAAGLSQHEPPDEYAIDLFTGAHGKGEHITLIEQHVSRAERLSKMTEHAFLGAYGQVFRALPYLQGTPTEAATQVFDLHRRYGLGVVEVVNRELQRNADISTILSLPPTSLLALIGAPVGLANAIADPTELAAPASVQAIADDRPVKNRRILFAIDATKREVVFADGPRLGGKSFDLFEKLLEQFHADIEAQRELESFAYVPTKTLKTALGIEEHALAQRALAIRKSLADQFVNAIDYALDEQDVIQSRKWKGYRLSPYLLQIELTQVIGAGRPQDSISKRDDSKMSR